MYHGRFDAKSGTFHAEPQYHGRFSVNRVNHPRSGHESRKVRVSEVEPPTLRVCIADGSEFKVGPSTLRVDITDGSTPKVEPSTLSLNIADGSMSIGRTFHAKGRYRGQFDVNKANHPR